MVQEQIRGHREVNTHRVAEDPRTYDFQRDFLQAHGKRAWDGLAS